MNDYKSSITVHTAPEEVFERIAQVSAWWASNFQGEARNIGDVFTIRFGDTWVTFCVTEVSPERRVTWKVTDCYLSWLEHKKEWNGTEVVWELTRQVGATRVDFTHVGLVPEFECFNDCSLGWNLTCRRASLAF